MRRRGRRLEVNVGDSNGEKSRVRLNRRVKVIVRSRLNKGERKVWDL